MTYTLMVLAKICLRDSSTWEMEEAFDDRSQTVGFQFPLLETTHLVELPEGPFLASGD